MPPPDSPPSAPVAPRLISDPRAIPVVSVDAHLPGIDETRLTASALGRRFQQPPLWRPEFVGDDRPTLDRPARPASVLLLLVDRPAGMHVLLTRRTEHLRDHAGQVSFPGGRSEESDEDAEDTALREAQEEVGLARSAVQVLGHLPRYRTVTAYDVTPVVALAQTPLALTLDPSEVAESFEVPLAFLMNPAHHRRHVIDFDGQRREFLSMPWHGVGSEGVAREFFVWGATAAMLRNFYRFLSAD